MRDLENYYLTYSSKGRGHFELLAIDKTTQKRYTAVTTDTITIDEAFNSDFDSECWYHDSIEDARKCVLDIIFR